MATYTITLLDAPITSLGVHSEAFDINASGTIAGGSMWSAPGIFPNVDIVSGAVLWNPLLVELPLLGSDVLACALNDAGAAVGIWGPVNGISPAQSFLYRNGDMQDLTGIFGAEQSAAKDINNNGVLAMAVGPGGAGQHAFLYDSQAGTPPMDLGLLPGHDTSYANAINNHGQVTGVSGIYARKVWHAFLYDGGLIDLGPVASVSDINDLGQVVGARLFGNAQYATAYLCDTAAGAPQFIDLGTLPLPGFVGSEARAINIHGDVVGGAYPPIGTGITHAFVCRTVRRAGQKPTMQDLNQLIPEDSGWLLIWAMAINDGGQIVGTGTFDGATRAFLLTPIPSRPFIPTFNAWAIDPLALLLGVDSPAYINLHLPDPPPPEVLLPQLRTVLKNMGPREKRQVLARVNGWSAFAQAVKQVLSEEGMG